MAGIIDLFIPKERKFFDFLRAQIKLLEESSDILQSVISKKNIDKEPTSKQVTQLRSLSKKADQLTHDITGFLHKTFITPIDREEIKELSTRISLIIYSLEKLLANIYYFDIKSKDNTSITQIKIIGEAVRHLVYVFEEPLLPKRNIEILDRIKDIEKEADDIYRKALGELFNNPNAVMIIKQKELYDNAENAIDNIMITADLLETVIINNS